MNTRQHLPPEGRDCLLDPTHGPSFIVGKGHSEWCPHSSHVTGSKVTPQLLAKQQVYLDDLAKRPVAS